MTICRANQFVLSVNGEPIMGEFPDKNQVLTFSIAPLAYRIDEPPDIDNSNIFMWVFEDYAIKQEDVDNAIQHDEYFHPFYGYNIPNFKIHINRFEFDADGNIVEVITLQKYLEQCEGL